MAIGEYGISLDKLVAASETIPNDQKTTVDLTTSPPEESTFLPQFYPVNLSLEQIKNIFRT